MQYRVTDSLTGNVTTMDWEGDQPPTDADIDSYLRPWGESALSMAKGVPQAVGAGLLGAGKAVGGWLQQFEELGPKTIPQALLQTPAMILEGSEKLARMFDESSGKLVGRPLPQIERPIPPLWPALKAGAQWMGEVIPDVNLGTEAGKGIAKYFEDTIETVRPKPKSETEKQVFGAMESVGLNLGLVGAAFTVGNPALALPAMALEQYGEAYAEQRAKGIDPSTATSAAITYALAEYWTEKIPLKILLNPKLSLGKRILGEILTDIPGELAATTIEQGLVDTVTTNPNATLGDFLTALKDTAIQTAIAAPLLGGASHPLVRWAEKAEARLIHDAVTTRSYIHMSDQELSDYVGKAQGLVKGHPEIQPDVNILMGDLARRQSYSDPIERQADEMLKKLSQELGVALGNPDLQHEMGLMDERDTARQMSAVTDEMAKPLFSKVAGETAPTTGDVAMRTSVYYDEVDRSLSGIRGALSKEETKVYSDRVRKRIDEGLNFPDWPYIPKVYSYAGGETTRAQHIIANKVAHNITVPEGILYNAIADPLRLRAEATRIANKEQYQFENLGLEENIFDHLVTRQGYEGYVERSARSNNEEVMLLFGLRKAEGAQKFGAAMSQQIDTVSTPPTTLAESLVLGRQQAPLLSTHAQEVGASYPEVKLSPSVIRQHYYGGESSGLLEPSIAITGTAPRQSLLSYLSEIGLSRDQNSVMVFLPDDEPNGHHVQFTLQAVDPELIKKQLDKMGVDEVNLTEGQDGSINVDTFIFDGWDQESTQKAAIKNAALIKLYHTYGTGDITQPRNAATFIERKDYHRNIRDFYGSEKGERVYGQRAEEGQQHRASVGRDQLERVRQREALEGGRGRARGKGYPGTQQGVQGYPESLTGPGEVLPREYAAQEEVVPEEKEASPEGETPPTLPNPAILFARDVSIPSYTLSYPPKPAYTPRQIVAMVRDFKKRIPSIGAVVVVKDVGGIPSHMVEKAGGIQEGDRVFGMYDPEHDTTYLIADSITSPLALHVLLLHEIIGHRGIIGVLGDRERSDVVDMVRRAYENTDVGRDVIKRYGLDMGSPGDQMRFGHELIAYMAETGEQASLLQRVIAMIKEALRKLGINLPFTDADVMNLIEKSYQFSRAVTRPVPISQAKPEFFKLTAEVAGLREQFSAAMPGNLASASPLERLLKTPMNIDNPHVKRLFELFQETRQELYNRHLIQLIGEGDDNSLDAKHKLMRQSPEDYLRFRDIWLWVDRHYQKTREEREDFQLLMRNLEQKVRNLGMSEEGIRVWRLDRETNDRALDALTAESRDLLNHLELESTVADDPFEAKDASRNWMSWDVEAADRFDGVKWFTVTDSTADRYHLPGAPGIHYRVGSLKGGGFGVRQVLFEKGTFNDDPEMMRAWWEQNKALFHKNNVDPRADLRQTLRGAIAMMGEMKGTYAPRVRPRGKYAVKAWRTVEGEKVFWRSNHGWSWSAGEQMKRLREDGWEDVRKVDVSTLPEDIYQNVRMADLTKAIQFTMDKARSGEYGTITPEMADMMYRDLNEMFSDMVKERGFLQHRMQRLRDVLVEGYETDPLQASIMYLSNVAGGLSKAVVSKDAMEILREMPYKGKDTQAYEYAREYVAENLRNLDHLDRFMGTMKTIASLKYLTSVVRTPLVNLTSLVTTAGPALHQYAGDREIPLRKVEGVLAKSIPDFIRYLKTKQLSTTEEKLFMDDMMKTQYTAPQYVRDAVTSLRSRSIGFWQQTLKYAFLMQSYSETLNRGATLLAAFRVANQELHAAGVTGENAFRIARQRAIDSMYQAHAAYGRANKPSIAWGTGIAARVASAGYTYLNFPHQYLQLLYDLGFKKRNITAATWLLLAPIVLGGAAAVPFKDDLLWMFGKLLFLLGVDKDPEKWWWDMVRTEWGKTMETAGRMGLSGLAGFDISGSLSIGAQMPSNVLELLGPIGGVVTDVWDATRYGWQGQPLRAMEMLAPRALSDVVRAYREETQGITTREYRPMFDETGRPVHPTTFDTITRGLGFRSAEVGRVSMHTSEVKREQAKLTDRRDEIYMRYRAWYSKPVKDVGEYSQITKMIHSYNTVASTMPGTPLIRMSSLKEQAKAMNVPSKSKRMQMR